MDNIIDELEARGFIDALTNKDEVRKQCEQPSHVYIGFDPTADSLHLGNLVGIIALAWFQRAGHTPVALMGGATGKIGDPSGKSVERPLLTYEELQNNVDSISKQFQQCLDFSGSLPKPLILNNDDWLSKCSLIDFLRDIGKHYRMGPMLSKESVKVRIQSEEGMSFTEFTYQIMQGYDFYHLNKDFDITIQMGGSDQWGNIVSGIELTRKLVQKEVFGVTFPLLTRSDGKKFGKSEGGAIWLSKHKCSPYKFYQYLYRIADADIIRMLKMLTFLPIDEINTMEKELSEGVLPPNSLQKRLAQEVTRFVHGDDGLKSAEKVTSALAPGSDTSIDVEIIESIFDEMPNAELSSSDVIDKTYADVASAAGLFQSKGEATRMVKNGGAYINNQKLEETAQLITEQTLVEGKFLLLAAGKKKKMIIKISE